MSEQQTPEPNPIASKLHVSHVRGINWLGLWTLTEREIKRFMAVSTQTLVAPLITLVLFYAVFAMTLRGRGIEMPGGISYMQFLAPGLIMMSMAQNAFANSSSSLIIGKMQGNIVDILMPPLSSFEILAGYVSGAVARGLAVGVVSIIFMSFLLEWPAFHPLMLLVYSVLGCTMLGTLGLLTGLWAEKFDHTAAISNFVVTPLTFLSGTFYALTSLPEIWQFAAHLNPFFYMIDGFRYALTGVSESPLSTGLLILCAVNAALLGFSAWLLRRGYKILS